MGGMGCRWNGEIARCGETHRATHPNDSWGQPSKLRLAAAQGIRNGLHGAGSDHEFIQIRLRRHALGSMAGDWTSANN